VAVATPVMINLCGYRLRRSTVWMSGLILLLLAFVLYLNLRVWSLESRISQWQGDYEHLEDRVIFLQSFASRMAQHVQQVCVHNQKSRTSAHICVG
jgi:hypothetical protein